MGGLDSLLFLGIITVASVGIYYMVLQAGNKVSDKMIDKGVDAIEKGAKSASQHLKPVVDEAKQKIEQTKKSILHPNTFSKVWTFVDFVNTYGPHVGIASHTNNITRDVFFTCEVSDNAGRTKSIRYSSQLGELNAKELASRKNALYVGQTNDGKYYLYDKEFKEWEDVELGD